MNVPINMCVSQYHNFINQIDVSTTSQYTFAELLLNKIIDKAI